MLKTEGKHAGEFLVSEAPGTLSRDKVTVTVPANTTLEPGSVLGKITATGKYVRYDDSLATGAEVAKGVLYNELENETGAPVDVETTIVNLNAEVRKADLVWLDEANDETPGLADLLALGIKARE